MILFLILIDNQIEMNHSDQILLVWSLKIN
jgi:hypothetical protein